VPEYGDALRPVQAFIQRCREYVAKFPPNATREYELEWRLGRAHKNSRFEPGVERQLWDRIVQETKDASFWKWEQVSEWLNVEDTFYSIVVRSPIGAGAGGKRRRVAAKDVRTRTVYDSQQDDAKPSIAHIHKKRVGECVLSICVANERNATRLATYDVRINLSVEETVSPSLIPKCVETQFVRRKYRKSLQRNPWRLEISKAWDGYAHDQAKKNEHTTDPKYEVEWECVDFPTLLASRSNVAIASSILTKILLLYPAHTVHLAALRQ